MDRVSTAFRAPWIWDALLRQTQTRAAPTSHNPALSPPGHPGATIRLGADRAAARLAALAVVRTVLVQSALQHTVRNWFELGALAGFLCIGALGGWVGAETCQGEPSPVPPAYPLPAPRSPNFNPKDFGFFGPGAPIISSQRASPPSQGSLTLENSPMLGFKVPSPLGLEPLLGSFRHPGSFPLLFIRSLLLELREPPPFQL